MWPNFTCKIAIIGVLTLVPEEVVLGMSLRSGERLCIISPVFGGVRQRDFTNEIQPVEGRTLVRTDVPLLVLFYL